MKANYKSRILAALLVVSGVLSGCSLDPGVRKQNDFARGQSYFQKGDYRDAAIEFANAIRIDPSYADAHLQLANTYLKMQQPDRAYQEFANVVQLRPDDYQTRITMTNMLIGSGRLAGAQEQTNLLLRQRPNDPAVHAMYASLLAQQGNIQGAIAEAQKTVALAPDQWPPYLSLALLQWKDNQSVAAEANLSKVISLDKSAAQPRVLLGTWYESQGHLDDAEQEFRDAMAVDAGNMEPRQALARLYLGEGKPGDAENVLLQASRDLPNNPESLLDLSNFYFVTGNLNKAVAEYQVLYQEHPGDLQIKKKFIQLLIQANRFDQASTLLNEILRTAPRDNDALLYRSEMQISSGDVSDAIATLQGVIKNTPDNSEAHYALGEAFRKQGDVEHAEGEWLEALRLNPDSVNAERSLADAAMEQDDMRALESYATQLIRLQPASPEGYSLRAMANINLKQFDQAEQDVQKAIAIAPQSSYGYVEMGNLRFSQQRYQEAEHAYQAALDRNAGSVDALRGLASTYIAEKQVDKGVAAVKQGIAASPANSSLYSLLGGILFRAKHDLNGAETAFTRATALDPHNVGGWVQLCEVQAAQGKLDEAIATDQQALKMNTGRPGLYLLLGNLYEAGPQWKNAENAYQSALAIDSQNPLASMGLAQVMLHTGGNLDVALSLAETARKAMPNSPAAADTTGWIYYQKGLYPLALSSLQQALSLQESNNVPDNPDIHYHLGMTYEKMKQPALARQQLEQVLKIDPTYGNAAQVRQELAGLKS